MVFAPRLPPFRSLQSALVVGSAALLLGGCDVPSFGWPEAITDGGEKIRNLWQGSMATGLVVGIVVWSLIIWSIVRYRRRSDDVPSQNEHNVPIEIFYTVVPILIVVVLFFFTVKTDQAIDLEAGGEPDLTVQVVGFQWQWEFRYLGEDVIVIGDNQGDPPEMVLPVGRTILFDLETADVIHSFWVPRFLTKRDMVPGLDNKLEVETTTTGTYTGRCAEFCGLDHWSMVFTVRIVPEAEYRAWLSEQQERGS